MFMRLENGAHGECEMPFIGIIILMSHTVYTVSIILVNFVGCIKPKNLVLKL